jgi:hypothetical protein
MQTWMLSRKRLKKQVDRVKQNPGIRAEKGVTLNGGERRRTLTPTLSLTTGRGGKGQLRHMEELRPAENAQVK